MLPEHAVLSGATQPGWESVQHAQCPCSKGLSAAVAAPSQAGNLCSTHSVLVRRTSLPQSRRPVRLETFATRTAPLFRGPGLFSLPRSRRPARLGICATRTVPLFRGPFCRGRGAQPGWKSAQYAQRPCQKDQPAAIAAPSQAGNLCNTYSALVQRAARSGTTL